MSPFTFHASVLFAAAEDELVESRSSFHFSLNCFSKSSQNEGFCSKYSLALGRPWAMFSPL